MTSSILARRAILFLYVKLFSIFQRLFPFQLSSSPYLSQYTYKTLCTYIFDGNPPLVTFDHDVIFVPFQYRYKIFQYLYFFTTPVVLVTSCNDGAFDLPPEMIDNHPKILRWFVQNNITTSYKCVSLPIGLEDRWRHNHGNIRDYNRLKSASTTSSRTPTILYSFTLGTNPAARGPALDILSQHPCAVYHKSPDPWSYRRSLLDVMFVASPPGNGIDCHRTWEALYLHCIPIVVNKTFYSHFSDFPGLVLDSWDQLNCYNMQSLTEVYYQCAEKLARCDYLWLPYWHKLINYYSQSLSSDSAT